MKVRCGEQGHSSGSCYIICTTFLIPDVQWGGGSRGSSLRLLRWRTNPRRLTGPCVDQLFRSCSWYSPCPPHAATVRTGTSRRLPRPRLRRPRRPPRQRRPPPPPPTSAVLCPPGAELGLAVGEQVILRNQSSYCFNCAASSSVTEYLVGVQSVGEAGVAVRTINVSGQRVTATAQQASGRERSGRGARAGRGHKAVPSVPCEPRVPAS